MGAEDCCCQSEMRAVQPNFNIINNSSSGVHGEYGMGKPLKIHISDHIHSDIHIDILGDHVDHPGVPVQVAEERRANTIANTIEFKNIIIGECAQLHLIICNQSFLNSTLFASYSISLKS